MEVHIFMPRYHWISGCEFEDPAWTLSTTGKYTTTFHHIVSRYTDWAISAVPSAVMLKQFLSNLM
jgi:hypothetical protein